MAQQFRTPAALAKDLVSFQNPLDGLQLPIIRTSKSTRHAHSAHTYTQAKHPYT